MRNKVKLPVLILLVCAGLSFAQNKNYDMLKHKYFGELKGKVLKVMDNTVQFKRADTGLIYSYEKKNIDYIIYSTGKWVSFKSDEKVFVVNSLGGWGFFHLSAGAVNNLKPAGNSDIWKYGISFSADLNYQANDFYSLGFLIGYDATNMKGERFLSHNSFPVSSTTGVTGGETYQLKFGLINRFWLLSSNFISPVISIFGGYQNLIVSDISINNSGTITTIPGETKKGGLVSAGLGFKLSTGEKSGILLGGNYNWFFSGGNRYRYLTFHMGYVLPIN